MRWRGVVLMALALACLAADTRGVGAKEVGLSSQVRRGLSQRMGIHGQDMEHLVWSVLLLQHKDAQTLARGMGQVERVSDDTPGVPADFMVLQDNMLQAASALSHAAQRKDDVETGRAFGQLMRSCVACHSAYLP